MNIIQGFIKIPLMTNNTPGIVAPFGELSPISLTFSRDVKMFASPTLYPTVELVTFKSVDITSSAIELPETMTNACLAIASWIYSQSKAKQIPANTQLTAFKQALVSEFSAVIDSYGLPTPISQVEIGEIMTTPNVGERLPDYVAFRINDGVKPYSIKFWFNDAKFQLQYLYYDMVVLPPLGVIDSLNGTTAQISTLLSGVTKTQIINQMNAVTQDNPATTVYPIKLRWHNPSNKTSILDTEWFVVIYGKAGIDSDAVKDAIRTHIAANTGNSNWTSIYPDLYAESEFIIVPFWDQLATADNGYDEGLYRTAINKETLKRIEQTKVPATYNTVTDFEAYKSLYLVTASSSYRSLMFYALGNPNNSGGFFSFIYLFPDYMDISTSSPDFSRLTLKTQGFVVQLNEALHKAREFTRSKAVPTGYTLTVKANREYLGFDYEGFTYHIQTRLGYRKNN